MGLSDLEKYVADNLPAELRLMQTGSYAAACPELTAALKAFIYHYTDEGFEAINAALHTSRGVARSVGSQGLAEALRRLPPYAGQVYSGARLSAEQLTALQAAANMKESVPWTWPAFLSASKSIATARQFGSIPGKNCLFLITSKTGRAIEALSRYGPGEREVLFLPRTPFRVTGVVPGPRYTEIILAEL